MTDAVKWPTRGELIEEAAALRQRLTRYENALLAIKYMDAYTPDGAAEPHDVMRQIATTALD